MADPTALERLERAWDGWTAAGDDTIAGSPESMAARTELEDAVAGLFVGAVPPAYRRGEPS
jgi:hypothetical protein